MKNEKLKRVLGFIMAVAIIITIAPSGVSASDDAPSAWAEHYAFMARAAYGLGDADTYADFRGGVTGMKLEAVSQSIAAAFDVYPSTIYTLENNPYLMRGVVITKLYQLIMAVTGEIMDADEYLAYFVENGLINGRASSDYQIDAICTVEEMIVFSVRVYEHLVYLTETYSVGFLWQVHGGASTVYLFGSIHLSDGSIYPFSPAVEAAFAASENLVLEVIMTDLDEATIAAYLMEKGLLLDGTTIADYISAEVYEIYVAVWESLGVSAMVYNYMQPWFAAMQLESLFALLAFGAESDNDIQDATFLGIDMHFLLRAIAAGKNLMELETFESQIDMLASFSPELQEAQLISMLMLFVQPDAENAELTAEEQEAAILAMLILLEAFKTGDEEVLAMFLGADIDIENMHPLDIEYLTKLLLERDIAMAAKIAELLEDGDNGDYFIIVGAAHLMGANSIIELLEDMGYTVERIR